MGKCVCYIGALDPLVQHSQWFGYYKTDVISWCGPFEVGLDCATSVTYGMLCNG
jgi:hypothetical protein